MCGFVAIISSGAPLPEKILSTMRDQLAHRGPDGAQNWSRSYPQGSVCFGFRRLAVIDVREDADQPMTSHDGHKVIVFNGEIYNYLEIKQELIAKGREFYTESDTEVLLQAYEFWGASMLKKLNGMFSFVIWDELKREALIARDRFGEKPLFYSHLPDGTLVLASEIKGLLAHPRLEVSVDKAILGKVAAGYVPFGGEETVFSGVYQFKAAHKMTVSLNGVFSSYDHYWSMSYSNEFSSMPQKKLCEMFRGYLERSSIQRMRADVPLTACLSGGIDSSSLVSIMAKSGLSTAISARFPEDPTMDEGPEIDAVLASTSVSGYSVTPKALDLVKDLRKLHWHHETVVPGASMYLEWAVMREAKRLGYTVIIDGQGADEVLAGYQIYFQAWQAELFFVNRERWKALYNGFVRDMRLRNLARRYENPTRRFSERDSLRPKEYFGWQRQIDNSLATYGGSDLLDPTALGPLRFELALNLLCTSLPSNLTSGDRNSMAHSIECRYPYLDYDLVDFASKLPNQSYMGAGWGKRILREAMKKSLPRRICWRVDKVGFAAPQDTWLKESALRDWIEERVFDDILIGVNSYHRALLETRWGQHLSGHVDWSTLLWRWASAAELLDMQRSGEWSPAN